MKPNPDLDILLVQLNQHRLNKVALESKIVPTLTKIASLESEIIGLVGTAKEGNKSLSGKRYIGTTSVKLNRTGDWTEFEKLVDSMGWEVLLAYFEPKVNVKASFKDLQKTNKALHKQLSACVTTKPTKTTVSFKPIEAKSNGV